MNSLTRLRVAYMKWSGKDWFSTTAAVLAVLTVCLISGSARADWSYHYSDSFSSTKAEDDSYSHSIIWPQGAFPPSQEAYLYYLDSGGLGFGDYNDEPAWLGYYFPIGSQDSPGAVYGEITIEAQFPQSSGYLFCSVTADDYTNTQELDSGTNTISIDSVWGRAYVVLFGSEVVIDSIQVNLGSPSANIRVPGDYATIQAAIDAASSGDIVEVSSGTYRGSGNRDLDFKGKSITVRSEDGPGSTTIDCGGQGHRGFYFHRGEGASSVLRGFTIVNGSVTGNTLPPDGASWNPSAAHPVGGGIFCESSSPSIIDCRIRRCSAELGGAIGAVNGDPEIIDCTIEDCGNGGFGAGIGLIRGSSATIIDSTIRNNSASSDSLGAGIYCAQSTALLANCNISGNSAQGSVKGGGIHIGGSSARMVLEQCIIAHNTAEAGAGIYANSPDYLRMINCTVANNSLSGGQAGGGIHAVGGSISIRNCIVWDNDGAAISFVSSASGGVAYSDIEGGFSGPGNINAAPMFASAGSGDYHLQSRNGRYNSSGNWVVDYNHSPCIDAGDPQDPVGSESFPNSKRINMGAYGGTHEASKSIGPVIFHVDRSRGSDSNAGMSRSDAFATIQGAVDEAIDGDIIMVWPGVYREEVVFNRKRITVQSADDAATVMAANGYAFSFYGAESSRSVLRNFVIINCGEAAVFCEGGSPELINLTMADNQFGVTAYGGANPTITNCILWNNALGDVFSDAFQLRAYYSCLQQLKAGDEDRGNISADPLFAEPGNGDYHLKSRFGRYSPSTGGWVEDEVNSPCLDRGDPGMHRGREPNGGRVNMGAYGGTPFASKSGPSW
ncbi:MAG: right-handed parallel beta-helix repeat-containing protein [Planctomycetota bacterium]